MRDRSRHLDEQTARLYGLALAYLRKAAGYTQTALAKLLGVPRKRICLWEAGAFGDRRHRDDLTWERLLEIAEKLGYEPEAVTWMMKALQTVRPREAERSAADPLAPTPAEKIRVAETARQAEQAALASLRTAKRDLAFASATEQLSRLGTGPLSAQLAALRAAPEFRAEPWALCLVACKESIRQLLHEPAIGRQVAELAVGAANLAGELPWKNGLAGIAVGHLGNAWRVIGDLHRADGLLFEEAERLWASSPPDPGILDPGRLLSLQASLRRSQRRLPEALHLVDKALSLSPSKGQLLLLKSQILEYMGRCPQALETLDDADRRLTEREPRDNYIVAMYRGVNLCHLRKFEEAAPFAATAMELAEQLENDFQAPRCFVPLDLQRRPRRPSLDSLRALWLHGRVAAGKRCFDIAQHIYHLLRREFTSRNLAYDIALLTLELALIYLEMNRPAAALNLARDLPADFEKRGVQREALAAVRLFFEAARRRDLTLELARTIVGYLYRVRHDASLPLITRYLEDSGR